MASIEIENLHQRFGSFHALKGIDLRIEEGEFFSLLGPSGSGKTSLLRLIAGFEPPTAGRIRIAGEDVTLAPPEHRRLGMVFQNYALFPHLSVFENVAYGLRAQGIPKKEIPERVEEALVLVDLPGFGDRDVHSLSGGQQQRVALARAIAPRPRVLLMDEPLSNLDSRLRTQTRSQIKSLQEKIGMTTVYVTHDQSEALALSDRLAILFEGSIQGLGTPEQLYSRPPSEAVGTFLGEMNLIECDVVRGNGESAVRIRFLGEEIPLQLMDASRDHVCVGVRPEAFALPGTHPCSARGGVSACHFEGEVWRLLLDVGGTPLRMNLPNNGVAAPPPIGGTWDFSFSPESLIVFETRP